MCFPLLRLPRCAAAAGDKKVAAALAEVEETHRAAVARLKADVQRKASALNTAKAEKPTAAREAPAGTGLSGSAEML
jgi:hypothetical protein